MTEFSFFGELWMFALKNCYHVKWFPCTWIYKLSALERNKL